MDSPRTKYGKWWQLWLPCEYGAEAGKRSGTILGLALGGGFLVLNGWALLGLGDFLLRIFR